MLEYTRNKIESIENNVGTSTTRADLYQALRSLSLSDFGELLFSIPNPAYPKLSELLPRMASEEIQLKWTGDSGYALLGQTLDFVRSLTYNYVKATGKTLEKARIVDFGCGFGRIARLMHYFVDENNFYGVDPWDRSIEICHADGLTKNFLVSDYLPSELPVEKTEFDLIFAFSVFTHLSERATTSSLNTLTKYLKPDGLLAITIRPIEYWDIDIRAKRTNLIDQQKILHQTNGFSFLPHNDREAVDGDITYGDTSMSFDWLLNKFPDLEIVGTDRSLNDQYQLYVFLKKIGR